MRIFLFLSLTLIALTRVASACSCAPPDPVKAAKKQADVVFVGKVKSVRFADQIGDSGQFTDRIATFEIARLWKGPDTTELEIHTGNICCICGVKFEVGDVFIIYASADSENRYSTSICSRTARISGRSNDEKKLGKPRVQKKQS